MAMATLESRSGTLGDESVDTGSLGDVECMGVSSGRNGILAGGEGEMQYLLPPRIGESDSPQSHQVWTVPSGIIEAEDRFQQMLPALLVSQSDQWVYVSSNGACKAFASQDEAEVAAETAGFQRNQFVVRLVSVLAQADEA